MLSTALEVTGVVRKRRLLYKAGSTRGHLGEVEGLGWLLEIEVLLGDGQTKEKGQPIAMELMKEFGVERPDWVEGAYIDLVKGRCTQQLIRHNRFRPAKSEEFTEMQIDYAQVSDEQYLGAHDHHVTPDLLKKLIDERKIIIVRDEGQQIGWLRFGYFCDVVPFMNMLWLQGDFRGRGLGRRLVEFWENEMRRTGHTRVMTSSQSNEVAQHFYRKLGYKDCGGFALPGEPLEIMFYKDL